MPTPPLPESPCLRVRLDYKNTDGTSAGSRFYLSYAGAAPTAGNCITIGGDIATAWSAHAAAVIAASWQLQEIDVLDIASLAGASGQWTGSEAGGMSGDPLPSSIASNVEFGIARRYRGGKPRMFWPSPDSTTLSDLSNYTNTFVAALQTATSGFFTAVEAISVGAVGALAHVNLSYYNGFQNFTSPSGRERAVPKYRATALVDTVNGYAPKKVLGSQRRRRTATTP